MAASIFFWRGKTKEVAKELTKSEKFRLQLQKLVGAVGSRAGKVISPETAETVFAIVVFSAFVLYATGLYPVFAEEETRPGSEDVEQAEDDILASFVSSQLVQTVERLNSGDEDADVVDRYQKAVDAGQVVITGDEEEVENEKSRTAFQFLLQTARRTTFTVETEEAAEKFLFESLQLEEEQIAAEAEKASQILLSLGDEEALGRLWQIVDPLLSEEALRRKVFDPFVMELVEKSTIGFSLPVAKRDDQFKKLVGAVEHLFMCVIGRKMLNNVPGLLKRSNKILSKAELKEYRDYIERSRSSMRLNGTEILNSRDAEEARQLAEEMEISDEELERLFVSVAESFNSKSLKVSEKPFVMQEKICLDEDEEEGSAEAAAATINMKWIALMQQSGVVAYLDSLNQVVSDIDKKLANQEGESEFDKYYRLEYPEWDSHLDLLLGPFKAPLKLTSEANTDQATKSAYDAIRQTRLERKEDIDDMPPVELAERSSQYARKEFPAGRSYLYGLQEPDADDAEAGIREAADRAGENLEREFLSKEGVEVKDKSELDGLMRMNEDLIPVVEYDPVKKKSIITRPSAAFETEEGREWSKKSAVKLESKLSRQARDWRLRQLQIYAWKLLDTDKRTQILLQMSRARERARTMNAADALEEFIRGKQSEINMGYYLDFVDMEKVKQRMQERELQEAEEKARETPEAAERGAYWECSECNRFRIFVARGREKKFLGPDFKCTTCGAPRHKLKKVIVEMKDPDEVDEDEEEEEDEEDDEWEQEIMREEAEAQIPELEGEEEDCFQFGKHRLLGASRDRDRDRPSKGVVGRTPVR